VIQAVGTLVPHLQRAIVTVTVAITEEEGVASVMDTEVIEVDDLTLIHICLG